MDSNITSTETDEIIRGKIVLKERPTSDIADERHKAMMDAIAPYAKKSVQNSENFPVFLCW